MSTHRLGIIGYGGFGQFLHNSWKTLPEIELRAVSDQNPTNRPQSGQVTFYQNWRDLLADHSIDIIAVATPPATHADITCEGLGAGKHVLVEKPLATTIQDAERIAEVQRRTGRLVTVDYMLRYNPLILALAEISHDKVFGELRRVAVENYAQDEVLPPEHWFWKRDLSGGILVEHAVHFIDLVHYLNNRTPRLISAAADQRSTGQEDIVIATILYDTGLIATHYHSFTRPGFFERTSIRLVYDLAEIELEGWIPLSGRIRALVDGQASERLQKLPGFTLRDARATSEIEDYSRPQGWGNTTEEAMLQRHQVRSRGITYPVDELISADFGLTQPKHEVYAASVRSLLLDFIHKIANPAYTPKVDFAAGLKSLELAVQATDEINRSLSRV